ncbi:MAG TPA: preprotein translocase subunit SecE [Desulfobacterales bacterium]|nr:preprotein translocase subunit SecE [Desulfobacterales bacterium]
MASKKAVGKNEGKKSFSIAAVKEFAGEVKMEWDKIAWPDRKHTLASTGVVIVFVSLISFYLGAVDLLLGKLIGLFLR